jgi:hypothetical protein
MFQLNKEEAAALRSQIATSNTGRGGRRYAPYVFAEQGMAMLSSVLRSKGAIAVNIEDHAGLQVLGPPTRPPPTHGDRDRESLDPWSRVSGHARWPSRR